MSRRLSGASVDLEAWRQRPLEGSNAYFFGLPMTGPFAVGLPDLAYPVAAFVTALVAMGVRVWRYRSRGP